VCENIFSNDVPILQRAQRTYDQRLAQCRRAREAASAEDSTQRQQLREADAALEAAQRARILSDIAFALSYRRPAALLKIPLIWQSRLL
jgi:hypothetical protein